MANKIGTIHQHELPSPYDKDIVLHDVYACHCGKEFYRGRDAERKEPMWVAVDDAGLPIKYDKTVGGKEFIGRADKDTVFDEEAVDQLAEEVTDESQGTSGETDGGEPSPGATT
jgi:hypothetical protein